MLTMSIGGPPLMTVKYITVKRCYSRLLGTVQKRPLYPKSVVSKLGYVWTAHHMHGHDVHATFLAYAIRLL